MEDEGTLINKEKEAYEKLIKAKNEWLDARIELAGRQIAKQIDADILTRLVNGK